MNTDYPTVSRDAAVQAAYLRLRKAGESPAMAEILATRASPGLRTDAQFLHGRHDAFGTDDAGLASRLRARGADPNGVYHSSLARYVGDPEAVVSGRDGIRKVCEKRGWSCEGTVNVRGRVEHTPLDGGVAEDIVARETAREIAADPGKGATKKRKAATKAAVRERLTGTADR